MFGRSKKKPRSFLRRLAYFVLLLSGSGAGIGGWALKDHPTVKALLTLVAGDAGKDDASDVEKSLVGEVVGLVKKGPDFTKAGVYQVTINKVGLAQAMFKPGHTVDIQAKVTRRDGRGQDSVVWESRNYGERLAVVGKDELTFGWPNRPFQVEWSPGEVVFLEVYDRKNGLFAAPKRFTLSSSNGESDFPLKTGDFTLEPQRKPEPQLDPRLNHVVLNSQLVGERDDRPKAPSRVANSNSDADSDSNRPIVIK
jgi:hypothetical protein